MELDSDFEDDLRAAVMDDVENELEDRLAEQAIEASHEQLEAVAARNDYDVENVIDSLEGPDVTRDGGTITVEWGWTHEAAGFFEMGTPDHVVEGNPVLAFEYPVSQGGPGGTVFSAGHEVTGIEQSRYARHGLRWLEQEMRQ